MEICGVNQKLKGRSFGLYSTQRSGKVLEPGEIHLNLRKAEVQQIKQGAKMYSAQAQEVE